MTVRESAAAVGWVERNRETHHPLLQMVQGLAIALDPSYNTPAAE